MANAAARGGTPTAWLGLGVRVVVGGTLVFSGLSKMPFHTEFIPVVNSFHILPAPLATAYAVALPWVELIVGAYLVFGIFVKLSALLAALMGISYAVANVSSIIHGEQLCGSCFGQISIPVVYSLTIDIFIVAAGVFLFLRSNRRLTLGGWLGKGKVVG